MESPLVLPPACLKFALLKQLTRVLKQSHERALSDILLWRRRPASRCITHLLLDRQRSSCPPLLYSRFNPKVYASYNRRGLQFFTAADVSTHYHHHHRCSERDLHLVYFSLLAQSRHAPYQTWRPRAPSFPNLTGICAVRLLPKQWA